MDQPYVMNTTRVVEGDYTKVTTFWSDGTKSVNYEHYEPAQVSLGSGYTGRVIPLVVAGLTVLAFIALFFLA
jgi:hypothetical protein